MKLVNILRRNTNVALITYADTNGNLQACIVDTDKLNFSKDETNIAENALKEATPYGVDWSLIFPDGLCITPEDFQNAMYKLGVISLDDLKDNPSSIRGVLQSLLNITSAKIYQKVKILMEDYHDSI